MLRISKMTDYGTLVLAELNGASEAPTSANDIASRTGLGAATVSKLLKSLSRAQLVRSQRGSNGGYSLAHAPGDISAARIIDAIEGPVAITECSSATPNCELSSVCGVGSAWQSINAAIRNALESISLDDLKTGRNIPDSFPIMPMPLRQFEKSPRATTVSREG